MVAGLQVTRSVAGLQVTRSVAGEIPAEIAVASGLQLEVTLQIAETELL